MINQACWYKHTQDADWRPGRLLQFLPGQYEPQAIVETADHCIAVVHPVFLRLAESELSEVTIHKSRYSQGE